MRIAILRSRNSIDLCQFNRRMGYIPNPRYMPYIGELRHLGFWKVGLDHMYHVYWSCDWDRQKTDAMGYVTLFAMGKVKKRGCNHQRRGAIAD